MTNKNLKISFLYKKYFDSGQYNYALKIADLGYACERIPEALWRIYKKNCLKELGGASSDFEYTEAFINDVMSLPFFSSLYHNRSLNYSNEIKTFAIKRLLEAINSFYSVNIDINSFCKSYDNFVTINREARLIELSFLDELVGTKITLDAFKYLLSSKDALRSVYSGKTISWFKYFLFQDFTKVLLDDTSTAYLSLYRPQISGVNFDNITHLRVVEKIADSVFYPDEYILTWEDKTIHFGEDSLSIEQFAISATTFNSWILVCTANCKILSCELPSSEIIDQQLSFFTGNALHSFFDSYLEDQYGFESNDKFKCIPPDLACICINPVHFLKHLIDTSCFPSSVDESINFFRNTLLSNCISEVKLNSISYLSSTEKEQSLSPTSCNIPRVKTISKRLSIRGAQAGATFEANYDGIDPFLDRPLFSYHTLYKREYNFNPTSKLCFIFCHFDALGELKKPVQHYLNALSGIGDIIFVSNSPALTENIIALDFLNEVCMSVYVRDNDSYDFGCWAYGISHNLPQIRAQYDHLICCNDSCIGPFCDLDIIINDFILGNVDVGGLTANKDRGLHLQSYFIFYGKNIINSSLFELFWKNIRSWKDKNDIINYYEVSWLRVLILSGYNVSVYFSDYFDASNNTVMKPLELLQSGFPFIKREVIEKNPFKIDLDEFLSSVSSLYPESSGLIKSIQQGEDFKSV